VAICIISLIIWRAYAHYVDNDIVGMYGKILCCEYRLNVPLRISLLSSLIQGLAKGSKKRNELKDFVNSEKFSKAYNEMFVLIDAKKVGSRGHNWLDGFALLFTFVLISVSFVFYYKMFSDIMSWIIGGLVIFIISVFYQSFW
jgi:hypothetical protein